MPHVAPLLRTVPRSFAAEMLASFNVSNVCLHYYPGHFPPVVNNIGKNRAAIGAGLVVALKGQTVLFRGEAWGGPSAIIPVAGGPDMTPTPQGEFVLMNPEPYKTDSWPMSRIKWGTRLKESPHDKDDVWYLASVKMGHENWASMKRDFGLTKETILNAYSEAMGKVHKKIPTSWILNDFGPLSVRFFVDKNRNGRLDPDLEKLEGAMFHTTPVNEMQTRQMKEPEMEVSHGCIHLKARDRGTLIGMKVLRAGTKLTIHPYNKRYGT